MANNNSLNKLLQKIASDEKYEEPNIQVEAISTKGANFTSNLYLASITDKCLESRRTLKLFIKIAAMNETLRNNSCGDSSNDLFKGFDIEKVTYTELFKNYKQLEEKYGVPEEHKIVLPKYYGSDSTHLREILVLEDLGSKGFQLHSRFKSVDWLYAKAAVTELAKFHALSFAFELQNPVEFNKLLKTFKPAQVPDDDMNIAAAKKLCQLAVDSVEENNKDKLKKFLDKSDVSYAVFHNLSSVIKRMVLVHADFRPSNMLYRKGNNGTTEVIPVDYQTIQAGSPAADLVYFIVCGTDAPFRAQYYEPLLDHYHSELRVALDRFELDVNEIYSMEDFQHEVKEKLSYGLQLAVLAMPIFTVVEDQAPKAEEMSLNNFFDIQPGDLYQTRINELVQDCVKWGVLTD